MIPSRRPLRGLTNQVADVATILIAVAGLAVAGTVLYDRVAVDSGPDGLEEDREVENWHEMVASSRMVGPQDASVVILTFADYECPFCRRSEKVLRALRERFPQDLSVGYKHLPLTSIHPNAYFAARLAECGAEQGGFEPVHTLLYQSVTLQGLEPEDLAGQAEIPDPAAFVECARRTEPVAQIEADMADASDLDIARTPTYIVEGTLLADVPDSTELAELVEEHRVRQE